MKEQQKQIKFVAVPQSAPPAAQWSETERKLSQEIETLRNENDQLRSRNTYLEGQLACHLWDSMV